MESLAAPHLRAKRKDERYFAHPHRSLILTQRQRCDLELLINGGFKPLTNFMNQADYQSVLLKMRLTNGQFWPVPITLDVSEAFANSLRFGETIGLRDAEGLLLALLEITERWYPNKLDEINILYPGENETHPGVTFLKYHSKPICLSGKLFPLSLPHHYDFNQYRLSPKQMIEFFEKNKAKTIIACQPEQPMSQSEIKAIEFLMNELDALLLIQPLVGMKKVDDITFYAEIRCYEHIAKKITAKLTHLSLLPLAKRDSWLRDILLRAIVQKNYGCTHVLIDPTLLSLQTSLLNFTFETLIPYQSTIGITFLRQPQMVYSQKHHSFFLKDNFPSDDQPLSLTHQAFYEKLCLGHDIPIWFSYPPVIEELKKAYPIKSESGFTVFLTGLPSSGKSTIANALMFKLKELTGRPITLLDGDEIRTHLSYGLGFSVEDREISTTRAGFVAKEITKHRGIVICALIAPYQRMRTKVREMVSAAGGFIEVYVATTLSVCETRDRKGMYKKAREGEIKQFTGISDPYEPPIMPEIKINTANKSVAEMVMKIIDKLTKLGYLAKKNE